MNKRTPLTVERIAQAALRLIDTDGLDTLSMRRLGAELGVEAMSIYKHLSDKEAVVDAAVALAYSDIVLPAADASWSDSIRTLAYELRKIICAHPYLATRMLTQPPSVSDVQRPANVLLESLRQTTKDDALVVRRFWLFMSYTTGALLSEIAGAASEMRSSKRSSTLHVATQPSPTDCPALAALGPALAQCDFAREYRFGVETLVALWSTS